MLEFKKIQGYIIEEFYFDVSKDLAYTSNLEAIAMVLAVLYLVLAMKQSLWCWASLFISTFIYSYIFFDALSLMDSVLIISFLLMAIYGWYLWKDTGKAQEKELEISTYGFSKNIKIIIVLTIISTILGYVMANYTSADFAYVDSFISVFAMFSTYMLAKKILESWIYWIVIDVVSIYVYIQKDLALTAILFSIYSVLAYMSYKTWKEEYAQPQLF